MKPPCDEAVIESWSVAVPYAEEAEPWILAVTILGSSMAFIDSTVVLLLVAPKHAPTRAADEKPIPRKERKNTTTPARNPPAHEAGLPLMCDDLLGRRVHYSIVSIYFLSRGSYPSRRSGESRSGYAAGWSALAARRANARQIHRPTFDLQSNDASTARFHA